MLHLVAFDTSPRGAPLSAWAGLVTGVIRSATRAAALIALTTGLALVLGAGVSVLGQGNLQVAVTVCMLPLLPVLVLHTQVAAVAVLACLPFELNVIGGTIGGINVAPADIFLCMTFVGILMALNWRGEIRQRLCFLRPMIPVILMYFAAAVVVSAANPSFLGAVALLQRVEIVVVPILIGALVLTTPSARRGMALFVAAALVLGIAFLLPHISSGGVLGVQKNPAGQYIVDAALIALTAFPAKWVRFTVLPILVLATYATQSRGALIGLAAGFVVYVVLCSRGPLQAFGRAIPLVSLMLMAYFLLPPEVQDRVLGNTLDTSHNDAVRAAYIDDAWRIFGEHPTVGVGIGKYLSGTPGAGGSFTNDPHNVLLLEAAEGGVVLVVAFLLLQLGAIVVVFRLRKFSPWAVPAICVQVAILVHGMVDVYWVRGTPVMGWLLIGLALVPVAQTSISARRAHSPAHAQVDP